MFIYHLAVNAHAKVGTGSASNPCERGWTLRGHGFEAEPVPPDAHYHKRSNVESTFSMIKAKFGDAVRSKTDVAMKNEALCKILCHNICCLIPSACEFGVATKFWGWDEPPEASDVTEDESLAALAWL